MFDTLELQSFVRYIDKCNGLELFYNGKKWNSNINDFMYEFVDKCYITHSFTKDYVVKNVVVDK